MNNHIEQIKKEFIEEKFLQSIDNERFRLHAFLSEALIHQKVRTEIEKEWDTFKHTIEYGMKCFLEEAEKMYSIEKKSTIKKQLDLVNESLKQSSWQEALLLCTPLVVLIYQTGKKLVATGNPRRGLPLLSVLPLLFPEASDPWLMLGIAYQEDLQIKEALLAYKHANRVDPNHPLSLLYQAECYVQLKEIGQAKECLNEAFHLISHNQNLQHYFKEARRIFNLI